MKRGMKKTSQFLGVALSAVLWENYLHCEGGHISTAWMMKGMEVGKENTVGKRGFLKEDSKVAAHSLRQGLTHNETFKHTCTHTMGTRWEVGQE